MTDDGVMSILSRDSSERGDVPGWVLITLMTAGLVVVMWAMAGPALGEVFNNAIDRVLSI
jgi:hypothetical protein